MNTHDKIELPPLPPADRYFEFDSHRMKASIDVPYWGEKSLEAYALAAIEADRKRRDISNATQACDMQSTEPVKRKRPYAQGTALGEFGVIPMCDQVDDEPVKFHPEVGKNAKKRFESAMKGRKETDPIERLRFYCSLAMSGQDWLDAEPFFDALVADRRRSGEPVAWPKVNGVGRDAGNAQSLVIYFAAEPTDDQMRAVHDVLAPAQPAAPVKVNAIFETQDGEVIGTTDAKVKRVEWQDDGSLTVVIDYWPQPAESIVSDVEAIVRLLERREWADHVATTPLGQRLETAVTALVGTDQQPAEPEQKPSVEALAEMANGWSFDRKELASKVLERRQTLKHQGYQPIQSGPLPPPPAPQPAEPVGEVLGETCIDGGKCHHGCKERCFRRQCCDPFSDYSGPWEYADETIYPQPAETVSIYVETRECHECGHVGINDAHVSKAACNSCDWTGYTPNVDRCPGCDQAGTMTAACPTCGGRYGLLAEKNITWISASAAQPAEPVKVLSDADILDLWTGDPTHSRPVMGKNKVIAFARAILARYGQHAQPAKSSLSVTYDDKGDCLYVVCDSNEPADAEDDDKGIIYRRAISDGRLVGVTIMSFLGRHAESSDDAPQPAEPDRGEPVAWKWRRTPATKWECVGHWDSIEAKAAAEMESQGWEVVRLYDSPQPPPSR